MTTRYRSLRRFLLPTIILAGLVGGSLNTRAQSAAGDPWSTAQTAQPSVLASRLAGKPAAKPIILQVGFNALYRSKHIPGSIYAGPASTPAGLETLKQVAGKFPRNTELYIYCGCCPINKCPNLRPAFEALRAMGFTHLHALILETNFGKNWVAQGYPVAGEAASSK